MAQASIATAAPLFAMWTWTCFSPRRRISPTSRATGLSVKSLELLEASGVTQRLVATGIKVNNAKIMQEKGKGITLDFNELAHKYNFLLCLPQNHTELIMQERFEELGGNVEYDTRLVSLTRKKDGTVEAVMEKNGKRLTESFNAVIGAGFTLRYVNDWSPSEEQVAQDPNLASELERPMLLIVLASA